MKRAHTDNFIGGAAILAVCLFWYISYAVTGNELVLPSPIACLQSVGKLLISAWFWKAFFATLSRVLIAFVISFALALIFALGSYLSPPFAAFLRPIVRIVRAFPTMAVVLLLLLWSGAERAPVIVAFLSLFPMLYEGVFSALTGVDKQLIQMSRLYHVPIQRQIQKLYLPCALPRVAREGAAALGFAVKLVVSAEVLAGTFISVGGAMQEARASMDIPLLFALTIVTVAFAAVLETVVCKLTRWCE